MDNQYENTGYTPAVGLAGKVVSALGGLAAGVGGLVLAVNGLIAGNLRKWSKPGFDAFDSYGKQLQQDTSFVTGDISISELRTTAKNKLKHAILARVEYGDVRKTMSDSKSLLGRALFQARNKQRYDAQSDVEIQNALRQVGEDGEIGLRQDIARLVVDDEKRMAETALRDAAGHVPLKEKLTLASDLHLSGRQKTAAVLAFAGAAAVAAGAIHLVMKHSQRSKVADNSAQLSW